MRTKTDLNIRAGVYNYATNQKMFAKESFLEFSYHEFKSLLVIIYAYDDSSSARHFKQFTPSF